MGKMNFKDIADIFFNNKANWKNVSDQDKEENFYIINRKFAIKYPEHAQYFNIKGTDRATAMDLWFLLLKKVNGIPPWWWASSMKNIKKVEKEKSLSKPDIELIKKYTQLSESDILFLYKYYPEEIKNESKKFYE